jgi:circadian clock protein KaiB
MSRSTQYKFRLYVAGDAHNSAQARANLNLLCQAHLAGRCEIDVVDVFEEPQRALSDAILMTPTLVQLAPLPVRRLVGTLSQTQTVLHALGLFGVSA